MVGVIFMSENKDLQSVFQEIESHNIQARDIVENCVRASNEESKQFLTIYIKSLEKFIKLIPYDRFKKLTSIVYRGLKFESEKAGALKYFYFGYYAKCQETILKKADEYYQRIKIDEIASKKHFNSIMIYLATNGISRQKDISSNLRINKSNLSRIMDEVVEYKLVNKIVGPKVVFYELTTNGYKYCKTHNLNNRSLTNKNIWLDNDRVLEDCKSQYNNQEVKEVIYYQVDSKLMLDDQNFINKAKFKSKEQFKESVGLMEVKKYNSLSRKSTDFERVLENYN